MTWFDLMPIFAGAALLGLIISNHMERRALRNLVDTQMEIIQKQREAMKNQREAMKNQDRTFDAQQETIAIYKQLVSRYEQAFLHMTEAERSQRTERPNHAPEPQIVQPKEGQQ